MTKRAAIVADKSTAGLLFNVTRTEVITVADATDVPYWESFNVGGRVVFHKYEPATATEVTDDAAAVVVGQTYPNAQILEIAIPATGGPFVDSNGDEVALGSNVLAKVPTGWSQAAASITPAEFAQVNMAEANAAVQISIAKNILEFVTGDVNPLEGYQEDLAGTDGKYYLISSAAAATAKITFSPLATYAAAGIQRIRVSCEDWSLRVGAVGVYETNGAETIRAVNGFPDAGSEWIDFVVDVANNQFIVASGGDIQISQAIPTYTLHTEVPSTIRLYLIDGTGADAEGLWRKEPITNAPNYIG